MPVTNHYTAFGLHFESELELPELLLCDAAADVTVSFGNVPEHLENPTEQTPWLTEKAGEFLLTVDGVARYFAAEGRSIVIEPFADADADDIRTFLYDSVFAALVEQRNLLALHGAAAVIGGRAVALLGNSSVGKTAVALELYRRGYPVLTDEICAVGTQAGRAVVYPAIPRLSVWKDTLETASIAASGLRPVRRDLHKFSFPVSARFAPAPTALSHIFLLEHHNREEILTEAIKGVDKPQHILWQESFMKMEADKAAHFNVFSAAFHLPMVRLYLNNIPGNAACAADTILREVGA